MTVTTLDILRERMLGARDFDWIPERRFPTSRTPAGVLIPLVLRSDGLQVLLTRRTEHLHHHPGQISFPGGRMEAGDADAVAAALRETEEEIGLSRDVIELLGALPDYTTNSGFLVTPAVGLLHPPLPLRPDSFEVAEVFEVPLAHLSDLRNYCRHRYEREGVGGYFYAVPYRGRFIWGVTAGILAMLAGFLQQS